MRSVRWRLCRIWTSLGGSRDGAPFGVGVGGGALVGVAGRSRGGGQRQVSAHEDEFREALIKYLRAEDSLSDDSHLIHFVVIANSVSMTDPEIERVATKSDSGLTFTHQMGLMEYAQANFRQRAAADD